MRTKAFAQDYSPTVVDRFGVYLSSRTIRRHVPSFAGKRVGDFGCGFHAAFARTILDQAAQVVLVDVALAEDLHRHERVKALQGPLPGILAEVADDSLDVILLVSVLEHLDEPEVALRHVRRILAPGGTFVVNVPSWRGKAYLELSAFRLGLSPRAEMDDHRMYYDVRDLWPLLVRAGFAPSAIQCYPHKFGLNTFAACRKSPANADAIDR